MTDAWLIACTWSVRRTMLEKPQLQPQPLKFAVFASQKRAKCAGLCAERSPQRTAHCRSLLKLRICRQHRARSSAQDRSCRSRPKCKLRVPRFTFVSFWSRGWPKPAVAEHAAARATRGARVPLRATPTRANKSRAEGLVFREHARAPLRLNTSAPPSPRTLSQRVRVRQPKLP